MGVLYTNDFDASTAGQLPTGWANVVGTWSVSTTRAASGQGLRPSSQAALDAALYTVTSLSDGSVAFDYKTVVAASTISASISAIFRCDATYANGYLINLANNGTLTFFKRVSGSYSQIGSPASITMPTYTVGDVLRVEVSFVGTALQYRIWNVTTGGTRPSTAMWSGTDATFSSGYTGVLNNIDAGGGANTPTADNYSIADTGSAAATTYTLSGPSTATVGSASSAFTVQASGSLSSAVVVTPSDGSGGGSFTPTTVTLAAGTNTSATFTYTSASAGSKTISTANNGGLTNPAAIALTANSSSVTIARSNAALYYSPGNWCDDGTSRISANPGAYVKFAFTGTSLTLLTTALASMSAYPQLRAIIDNVEYNVGMSTATSFAIVSGLTSGTHTCELYLRSSLWSAGSWWNLANALKITGFQVDAGATVSAYTPRSKTMFIFGDSLTQSYFLDGLSSPANDDALGNYPSPMAEALGAEYGQIGWGGTNYATAGVSDVPQFNTSYALVGAGQSRMSGAVFAIQPDYISVMLGTNGVAAQASVATAITNLRTAAPNAWIFLIVPGCGQSRANIAAAVTAAADAKVVLIDAGAGSLQAGLSGTSGAATEAAFDGVHYKRRTNMRLCSEWVRQIQRALEPRRFTVSVV